MENHFLGEDAKFLNLLNDGAFVDKTNFIRSVYKPNRTIMITAPRRFGKSTNLQMLQDFFSKTSNNLNKQRYNKYSIFKDNKFFFDAHFESHPVLYIDLKAPPGVFEEPSYDNAVSFIKSVIQKTFLSQANIYNSPERVSKDRNMAEHWCTKDYEYILGKNEIEVIDDLKKLIIMMEQAHNRKVIVLIDEFDSIINEALCRDPMIYYEFFRIVKLIRLFLYKLLRNNVHVNLAVVAGVSNRFTASKFENLEIYPFLENHQFVKYFGFTEEEFDFLFQMEGFEYMSERKKEMESLYGGFFSKNGLLMFNPYSVIKCFKRNQFVPFWNIADYVSRFAWLASFPEGASIVDKLLKNKCLKVKMDIEKFKLGEVTDLKKFFCQERPEKSLYDSLMPYFFDLGLVSYTRNVSLKESEDGKFLIKIPNGEVYQKALKRLMIFLVMACDLPDYFHKYNHYKQIVRVIDQTKAYPKWCSLFINECNQQRI